MRTSFPILLALVLVSPSIRGLDPEQTAAPEEVVVPLGVYDGQGNLVRDVRAEHVRLRGGEVRGLTLDDGPQRLIVLLDLTASMGWEEFGEKLKWNRARQFVRAFLQAANPSDEVALHAFAERHKVLVPFTHEREETLRALDSLPSPGSQECKDVFGFYNGLADALLAASEQNGTEGAAIVLISDGMPSDRSQARRRDAINVLVRKGIRIFYINVAEPELSPPPGTGFAHYDVWRHWERSIVFYDLISQLPTDTGGAEIFLWQQALYVSGKGLQLPDNAMTSLTGQMYTRIKPVYRLTVGTNNQAQKKEKLAIELRDEKGRKRSDLRLVYPRALYLRRVAGD